MSDLTDFTVNFDITNIAAKVEKKNEPKFETLNQEISGLKTSVTNLADEHKAFKENDRSQKVD